MRVRVTATAHLQLDTLAAWWKSNRTKAQPLKRLFLATVKRIQLVPLGRPEYLVVEDTVFRRALIRTTPYHVYYTVREADVVIAAVWSGELDYGPPLDLEEINSLR